MASQSKEEIWKERIARWRESGLSQRAYALQHGHPVRQVGYWVRRQVTGLYSHGRRLRKFPAAVGQVLHGPDVGIEDL